MCLVAMAANVITTPVAFTAGQSKLALIHTTRTSLFLLVWILGNGKQSSPRITADGFGVNFFSDRYDDDDIQ